MKYIIGIDGGGTKTLAYIANLEGDILGKTATGPSNYHSVGLERTKVAIFKVIQKLCSLVNISVDGLELLVLGLAGIDRDEDQRVVLEMLRSNGLNNRILLKSDAYVALVGAHGKQSGIITISGTGSICYGINRSGKIVRCGGWGHIIGYVYREDVTKEDIAQLAPLVLKAAQEKDEVAINIVNEAIDRLLEITDRVIRNLDFNERVINLAIDGGTLRKIPFVQKTFIRKIKERYDDIEVYPPLFDEGIGALLVGWDYLYAKQTMDEVILSGGGSYNKTLVEMIREELKGVKVMTQEDLGLEEPW